ncbi:hypothetical protein EC991_006689 [Linnemannia zychae]|nr:hypothetical protein EC991_006689 [Linnemannia zychae]
MVYEATTFITLPVGGQWKTFQKQDLLDKYDLPTPAHLLLGILTSNNYTDGVPSYGLLSNAEIVRSFTLNELQGLDDQGRLNQFTDYVSEHLDTVHGNAKAVQVLAQKSLLDRVRRGVQDGKARIKDLGRIENAEYQLAVEVDQFEYALQAFVMCTENPLPVSETETASCTPDTHSPSQVIIQQIEIKKAKSNWERFSKTRTSQAGPPAPVPVAQEPTFYKKRDQGTKQERRHSRRARSRRQEKWQRTEFRSRTDQADRYVPQTVHLDKASPIEDIELSGLKPSTARPRKPKVSTSGVNQPATTTPATTPATKRKKKKLLPHPAGKPGHANLKKSFKSVFATITLLTGSIKGCLHRTTNLSPANVDLVAQRLDMVVSTINAAKHVVYKMLEMRIFRELFPNPQGQVVASAQTSFLDLILDSDWAETVVGNLLSFVLRNETNLLGPAARNPNRQQAQAEAQSIFDEFKKLLPGFTALNPSKLPLGITIDDLAPKICLAIKLHYRRLPQTIRTKMEKLGFDSTLLPKVEQEDKDTSDDDDTTPDDDGTTPDDEADDEDVKKKSKKIDFSPQHIQSRWGYPMKLPAANRPRFCIQSKMTDSFIDIREETLFRILWRKKSDTIWGGSTHNFDWAKRQVNISFGNVIKMLFIGDPDTVRLATKHQTTYGKRTTTIDERATAHSTMYGQEPLARYQIDRINYYRAKYNASIPARSSSSSASTTLPPPPNPPPLPAPPGPRLFRYALNNYIRTDGHQLQLLAYDLTKNRQALGHKVFLRCIEKQYTTRQSIIDTFGQNSSSVVVVGIDPGEVVSGAFCMRPNDNTVQYFELEPIIHGFYSSSDWKRAVHQHRMAKLAEMDMAVAGVLRLVDEALKNTPMADRRVLFALGNATFRTGFNLASVHTTFLRRLQQKSIALGYKVALEDEYLTSTMCPTCVSAGVTARLAKPSMRTCACVGCKRWIHRDLVGAHNIAIVGEHYLKHLARPSSLERPQSQGS